MEKQEAHVKGFLHRAFSVFIFNENKDLLLQKRADDKYHSAGLWSNTCCSHPRENETTLFAAKRRLKEEMGLICKIKKEFDFIYKTKLRNGLFEHEFDHVFFGITNQKPKINKEEVSSYRYSSIKEIEKEMIKKPYIFTEWFKICFNEVKYKINI